LNSTPASGRFYSQTPDPGHANNGITARFSSIARQSGSKHLNDKDLILWSLFDQGNGFAQFTAFFDRARAGTHRVIHTFCG
jgi:hypothetical protein